MLATQCQNPRASSSCAPGAQAWHYVYPLFAFCFRTELKLVLAESFDADNGLICGHADLCVSDRMTLRGTSDGALRPRGATPSLRKTSRRQSTSRLIFPHFNFPCFSAHVDGRACRYSQSSGAPKTHTDSIHRTPLQHVRLPQPRSSRATFR